MVTGRFRGLRCAATVASAGPAAVAPAVKAPERAFRGPLRLVAAKGCGELGRLRAMAPALLVTTAPPLRRSGRGAGRAHDRGTVATQSEKRPNGERLRRRTRSAPGGAPRTRWMSGLVRPYLRTLVGISRTRLVPRLRPPQARRDPKTLGRPGPRRTGHPRPPLGAGTNQARPVRKLEDATRAYSADRYQDALRILRKLAAQAPIGCG